MTLRTFRCAVLALCIFSLTTLCFGMNSTTTTTIQSGLDNVVITVNETTVAAAAAAVVVVDNNQTTTTTLDQRVDQFLSQLPPEVLNTTIEPADAGRMLAILFHLKNVVKAARVGGKSMLTPLMLQMMASQIGGGSGSGGDPSKGLHVSLNMKDMMPLVAHFLDSTSRKCMPHSANGTFAVSSGLSGLGGLGGGGSDTEALLALMSNVFQQQQPQLTAQQTAAEKLAAEKAEKGNFDFQQFIMQIATKMIADVASSAISGGRSAA